MSWFTSGANSVSKFMLQRPIGYGAAAGAAIGGLMGGLSNDRNSSFLGGALTGAAIGAGVGFGARMVARPAFQRGLRSAWNAGAGNGIGGAFHRAAIYSGRQLGAEIRSSASGLYGRARSYWSPAAGAKKASAATSAKGAQAAAQGAVSAAKMGNPTVASNRAVNRVASTYKGPSIANMNMWDDINAGWDSTLNNTALIRRMRGQAKLGSRGVFF